MKSHEKKKAAAPVSCQVQKRDEEGDTLVLVVDQSIIDSLPDQPVAMELDADAFYTDENNVSHIHESALKLLQNASVSAGTAPYQTVVVMNQELNNFQISAAEVNEAPTECKPTEALSASDILFQNVKTIPSNDSVV